MTPGREAHLSGRVAEALMAQAADLFAEPPDIRPADVIAAKLPAWSRIGPSNADSICENCPGRHRAALRLGSPVGSLVEEHRCGDLIRSPAPIISDQRWRPDWPKGYPKGSFLHNPLTTL
jgi:hypothetical protein